MCEKAGQPPNGRAGEFTQSSIGNCNLHVRRCPVIARETFPWTWRYKASDQSDGSDLGISPGEMMAKARKQRSKISLFPTDQQLRTGRAKLPVFKSHDLRALISEARANDKISLDVAVLGTLRRRNDMQMKELLQHLGVDSSRPDAWMRGFFLLATFHHGVGHVASYPQRTNRNSATWTSTHDLALLRDVMTLQEQGFSGRKAVKKLAADPKKRQLFPYRKQGHFSTAGEQQRREAALWARLQKLRASTHGLQTLSLERAWIASAQWSAHCTISICRILKPEEW
jgi:hypothetical protein